MFKCFFFHFLVRSSYFCLFVFCYFYSTVIQNWIIYYMTHSFFYLKIPEDLIRIIHKGRFLFLHIPFERNSQGSIFCTALCESLSPACSAYSRTPCAQACCILFQWDYLFHHFPSITFVCYSYFIDFRSNIIGFLTFPSILFRIFLWNKISFEINFCYGI